MEAEFWESSLNFVGCKWKEYLGIQQYWRWNTSTLGIQDSSSNLVFHLATRSRILVLLSGATRLDDQIPASLGTSLPGFSFELVDICPQLQFNSLREKFYLAYLITFWPCWNIAFVQTASETVCQVEIWFPWVSAHGPRVPSPQVCSVARGGGDCLVG